MAAFGTNEPIAGRLFADTLCPPGAVIDFARTCDARVEGEILIEIGSVPAPTFDDAQLLGSIATIRTAIEIADSRITGWPSEAPAAIADNACCGWVIVGEPHDASAFDLAEIALQMTADYAVVAEGKGSNCLGNPLNVYRWFVGKAAQLGWSIEPGQMLLTGAIAPPVRAAAGTRYEASLTGLGAVNFSFRETVVA
jgi:2-keto-4-pentenoate hydratase